MISALQNVTDLEENEEYKKGKRALCSNGFSTFSVCSFLVLLFSLNVANTFREQQHV